MKYYRFKLHLNSDTGKHNVVIAAESETSAREIVCNFLNCPERAILSADNLGILKGLKPAK